MILKGGFAMIRYLKGEDGATAVEYGIMVSLIAAAIVITVTALGGQLNAVFTNVVGALK